MLTTLQDIISLADRGVCCLAVLVGNAHGHYKKPPCLDISRIAAVKALAQTKIELCGAMGKWG